MRGGEFDGATRRRRSLADGDCRARRFSGSAAETQSALARSTPIKDIGGRDWKFRESVLIEFQAQTTSPTRSFFLSPRPHYLRERVWARAPVAARLYLFAPAFAPAPRARVAFRERGHW